MSRKLDWRNNKLGGEMVGCFRRPDFVTAGALLLATACSPSNADERCSELMEDRVLGLCQERYCDIKFDIDGKGGISLEVTPDTLPEVSAEDQLACSLACTNCKPLQDSSGAGGTSEVGSGGATPGIGGSSEAASGGTTSTGVGGTSEDGSGGDFVSSGGTGGGLPEGTGGAPFPDVGLVGLDPGEVYAPCQEEDTESPLCPDSAAVSRADSDVCVCTTECLSSQDCPESPTGHGKPYCLVGSQSAVGRCFLQCDLSDPIGTCASGLACDAVSGATICFNSAE
jgi:hypothetical protein